MGRLEKLTARQTRRLLAREREVQREVFRQYGLALGDSERELRRLNQLIAQAIDTGQTVDEKWLLRQASYQRWLGLTRSELARYTARLAPLLVDLQDAHARQALDDAHDLIAAAIGTERQMVSAGVSFRVPPADVVAQAVGQAMDGTPLYDLLKVAAGDSADAARDALIRGVIEDKGPRHIGREIRKATRISRDRAVLIARQESLGAYRAVTSQTFQSNPQVVKTWVWTAALDRRTCSVCWAQHGTEHPIAETLASHIGCRCAMVPQTVSWKDLGIDLPDNRASIRTGAELFDELPSADQLAILGRGKLDAYNAGKITLDDLVQPTRSKRWGPGLRERTLRELV